MKFEKIIIPPGWQESFTKYPNGKTIFEALSSTITTVNEGIEEVNEKVNQGLIAIDQAENTTRQEITESFNTLKLQLEGEIDGLSDDLIDDFALLQSDVLTLISGKANAADVYTKQQVDAQLAHNVAIIENIHTDIKVEFGAKGDGATDDKVAILNALNSNSKHIYFPAGTYRVTPPLILDSSTNNKTITFDPSAKIVFNNVIAHGLHLNGCHNLDFFNLNLEHLGADGDANTIRFDNGSHEIKFHGRTRVYDSPAWAVNIRGGSHDIYFQYIDVNNIVKGISRTGADGIDLHSCYNITIDVAIIKAGDDGLCIKSVGDGATQTRNINIGMIWAKAHGGAISFGSEIRQDCYNINVGQVISYESLYAVYIRNDASGTGKLYNVNIGQVTHYDRVGSTSWVMLAYSHDNIERFKGIHIGSIVAEGAVGWDFIELRNIQDVVIDNVSLVQYEFVGNRLFGTQTRNRHGLHFNKARRCKVGSGYIENSQQSLYFYGSQDNHVVDIVCKTLSTTPIIFAGDNITETPSINNTLEMVDVRESAGNIIGTHTPSYVPSSLRNNMLVRMKGVKSEGVVKATILNGQSQVDIPHGLPVSPNKAYSFSNSGDNTWVGYMSDTIVRVYRTGTTGNREVSVFVSL